MPRSFCTLFFLAVVFSAIVAYAEDDARPYDNAPEELVLECLPDPTHEIDVFSRKFRIPESYAPSGGYGLNFAWTLHLSGGLFTVPFSTIGAGSSLLISDQFRNYPSVSEHSDNPLGVRIVYLVPADDEPQDHFTVLMTQGESFLRVSSMVPIDLESILDCFE